MRLAAPIVSLSDSTPSGLGVTFEGQIKWAVIAAGRVGYAINDFLPYFIAGAVWGRGEATVVGVGAAEASHTGYMLGGGLEYRFAPNWSVDLNYTHVSMSKETYDFTPYGGLAVSEGFRTDTVSVGVNYRF